MKTLTLQRRRSDADGTLGELLELDLKTIEEEDRNNLAGESRVPPGKYVCVPTFFHGGQYETYELLNVPDRSRILFHVANTEEDLQGCIGPGLAWGKLLVNDEDGGGRRRLKAGVTGSRKAFAKFMKWAGGELFELTILAEDPALPPVRLEVIDSIEGD